jgi:hypothetical protein
MVRDWLGRFDKDAKESRKQRIFDLWLEGNENKDISEIVGLSQLLLSEITSNFGIGDLAKTELAKANHADEAFQIPIYNRRKKTVGALDNFRIISGQIYNRRKKAYGNEGGNSDRTKLSPQIEDLKTSSIVATELGVSKATIPSPSFARRVQT